MPIRKGSVVIGNTKLYYYQFGTRGTKYFFSPNNKKQENLAYNKCLKQSRAIEFSKYNKKK